MYFGLFMDENAETIGQPAPSDQGTTAGDEEEPTDRLADPFGSRAQAGKVTETLLASLRSGIEPSSTSADWHVPFLLNEETAKFRFATELRSAWQRVPTHLTGLERTAEVLRSVVVGWSARIATQEPRRSMAGQRSRWFLSRFKAFQPTGVSQ